jgi:hypothetical protein
LLFAFGSSITIMASSSSSSNSANYDMPWVEKYRPTKVIDIVGNEDAVSRLQVIARDGNMPNLILSVNHFTHSFQFIIQFLCPNFPFCYSHS